MLLFRTLFVINSVHVYYGFELFRNNYRKDYIYLCDVRVRNRLASRRGAVNDKLNMQIELLNVR